MGVTLTMNAVDLFDTMGVLDKITWLSKDKCRARIQLRAGARLTVQVELPFCKTWIPDRIWYLEEFLNFHKPLR